MTSEKQKLIQSMLEMQKKFIDLEHGNGIDVEHYFAPDADHVLAGYRREYNDMANRLVDLAHEEKGSKR